MTGMSLVSFSLIEPARMTRVVSLDIFFGYMSCREALRGTYLEREVDDSEEVKIKKPESVRMLYRKFLEMCSLLDLNGRLLDHGSENAWALRCENTGV